MKAIMESLPGGVEKPKICTASLVRDHSAHRSQPHPTGTALCPLRPVRGAGAAAALPGVPHRDPMPPSAPAAPDPLGGLPRSTPGTGTPARSSVSPEGAGGRDSPAPHLVAEDLVQGGPGAAQGAEEGEPEAERAVVGGLQQHHLRHDQRRVPHVAAELRRHLTADGAAGRRRAAPRSGREDPGWGPGGCSMPGLLGSARGALRHGRSCPAASVAFSFPQPAARPSLLQHVALEQ